MGFYDDFFEEYGLSRPSKRSYPQEKGLKIKPLD
jgi:hypothetical protein